jgi:hypothetical protein
MVHRTDIAGGSLGQVSPDDDRMCRRAPKWPFSKTIVCPDRCLLQPAVDAIHFELTTP